MQVSGLKTACAAGGSGERRLSALAVSPGKCMESDSGLKTTITGDTQIEITGGAFFVGKIVLMSGLETAKVFSGAARACACGKQLHLLLRRRCHC